MFDSSGIFINGEWRHKKIEQASAVYNPSTEEIIGTVAVATEQDLDDAVATAQRPSINGATLTHGSVLQYCARSHSCCANALLRSS